MCWFYSVFFCYGEITFTPQIFLCYGFTHFWLQLYHTLWNLSKGGCLFVEVKLQKIAKECQKCYNAFYLLQKIYCAYRTIFISVSYEIIKLQPSKKMVCFFYKPAWFVRNDRIKDRPNTESDTEEIAGLQTNCDLQTTVPLSDKTYLFYLLFLWRAGSLVISIKWEGVAFSLFFFCRGWSKYWFVLFPNFILLTFNSIKIYIYIISLLKETPLVL